MCELSEDQVEAIQRLQHAWQVGLTAGESMALSMMLEGFEEGRPIGRYSPFASKWNVPSERYCCDINAFVAGNLMRVGKACQSVAGCAPRQDRQTRSDLTDVFAEYVDSVWIDGRPNATNGNRSGVLR
jgi:hypothetical protein